MHSQTSEPHLRSILRPSALPPGQVTRVLVPALDVFADERIETDPGGVTQILFRDGSHMTIGPNSDLVIDRFIFDPDTSTGEMAISLGRGVLRFVGGQLSKERHGDAGDAGGRDRRARRHCGGRT